MYAFMFIFIDISINAKVTERVKKKEEKGIIYNCNCSLRYAG